MLCKIRFFCLFSLVLFNTVTAIEHVYLKAPNISKEAIIDTEVGIRPFRKTGVRIEAENFQDKLIVHNYGYGGSGLTLAFGGAQEVLEILNQQNKDSRVVAILGAGVVGLATAYELLEKGYEVHLYSEKWNPNLTSNVAAGIWTPLKFPSDISQDKQDLHQRMLEIAEKRFLSSVSCNPEFAGIKKMNYYKLLPDDVQETVTKASHISDVVIHFDNGVIKKAEKTSRLGIDGKVFMEDLYCKVKDKGAILHQKSFENIDHVLELKESIIVNCMSMGSAEIFNDQDFIPIRGQLIHFLPQNVDYFLFQILSESNYFFNLYPWSDRLILGGVYEHNESTAKTCPEVIDEIIRIAEKCLSN